MDIKNKGLFQDIIYLGIFVLIATIGRAVLVGYNLQPFPNFEIIMVVTFIAALVLRSTLAFMVPLFSMIISDLMLGNSIFVGSQMNRIVLFTYSGFAIISLIGIFGKNKIGKYFEEIKIKNVGVAAGFGFLFVLIYDVWTNIGWWYIMYPNTLGSLAAVFSAGIPFMIYHLISGVLTFVVIALPFFSFVKSEKSISLPLSTKVNKYHKITVLAVSFLLIILSFTGTAMKIPENSEVWLEESDETSVKILITGENFNIEDNILAYEDETVFDLLSRFCKRNNLDLKYTYYEQFDAVLIDSIEENINGENSRYWQYYVNDPSVPPMVGCDKYQISNGDCLEWRYEVINH